MKRTNVPSSTSNIGDRFPSNRISSKNYVDKVIRWFNFRKIPSIFQSQAMQI